ncbi:RNA pseudouridine synthase [Aliidiomarina minuta]|uniref:Dual-specificity RNA pseudouridine synthase RluA n=1 Tax=Aliidiomarina minuta TaxID=880057 RepID=A0A432W4B8_9GAMM|nr:pseudouridine synthase [Aliidiomarina minuta]RUO24309.1 RNA pseudouridine synthase [Aliidiomarina minuta]
MSNFVYQPPQTPWLELVYRDEHLLIVAKPSGLLTVPGKAAEHKDCVENRVKSVLPTARIVHRLDMATSGLLLMALDKGTQGALGQQFERREVSKVYRARVWGKLPQEEGSIELPLRCDWPNRPRQMVDHEQGKSALTHYKVQSRSQHYSDVLLFPVTGRSHQLRVHMWQSGCPILGDRLYGSPQSTQAAPRLLLHAEELRFSHPHSGEACHFKLPANF